MSSGSWDRSWSNPPHASVFHIREWNGSDRQFRQYPKASLVSVDRAGTLWDDLEESSASRLLAASSARREAAKDKRLKGLATSGQGFFLYGKAKGDKPPKREYVVDNPYSVWEVIRKDCLGEFRRSDGSSYVGGLMASSNPSWAATGLLDSKDQLKLINRLREKTQGSGFNAGILLAEAGEGVRLVADTAIRVAKSIHHITRGDVAGSARALFERTSRAPIKPYSSMRPIKPTADRVSAHWLELQYGWLPLLGEAHAGAEFVAHQLHAPLRQKYKASVRRELVSIYNETFWAAPLTATSIRTHMRWLTAVMAEDYVPSYLDHLDPWTIGWERVPFSFVADWFIPFGSWLGARAAVNTLKCEYHVTADKTEGRSHPPRSTALTPLGEAGFYDVRFSRQVTAGNPRVPLPEFTPLSQVPTITRCLNAISLVAQAFLGGVGRWNRPLG